MIMKTVTVDTICGRDVRHTTAAEWAVYRTLRGAKRNQANGAYNPVVAEWGGGYITAPLGHPIPDGALVVAAFAFGRWSDLRGCPD